MTRLQRTATAALTTAGVAAMALIAVPASADAEDAPPGAQDARAVHWDVKASEVPGQAAGSDPAGAVARRHAADRSDLLLSAEVAGRQQRAEKKASDEAARQAEEERAADEAREEQAADARAEKRTHAPRRQAQPPAAETPEPAPAPAATTDAKPAEPAAPAPTAAPATPRPAAAPAAETYPDTLDGWIRESLAVMAREGIPGTYDGLYRNIMRESSGNPNAINLWDINAINGTPSIGLLQVIQPTFDTYHVPGTPVDIYDPVANITAAANYAYHRYGSIDNVNGPY
ncbi:transglycosylase SLT domain-containing protein [Streptomyces avicenniae]|uniref:lytic transglycosylase domain-containing protein n=1 Tax=Streptomyces avicenniae TaxID=500153 RepID=UPI001CBA6B36|nr:transglycosylase SLT domain-containing protein [Streptomyces avicenniae]